MLILLIILMWEREAWREDHRVEYTQGAVGPNYWLDQAQSSQDNSIKEIEEDGPPKEPKE